MTWQPNEFYVAIPVGPLKVAGYTFKGLGLHKIAPKAKAWTLTHLNTGHSICHIEGGMAEVFPVAADIANCSEWDFDGLRGWTNRDPELGDKVQDILDSYNGKWTRHKSTGGDEVVARKVLETRP